MAAQHLLRDLITAEQDTVTTRSKKEVKVVAAGAQASLLTKRPDVLRLPNRVELIIYLAINSRSNAK